MTILDIYSYTLPIVATENLIMGITLLILQYSTKSPQKNQPEKGRHRQSLLFLAIAMLMMALVNFIEPISPRKASIFHSLSYVIPAAAIQMFLLLQAYGALLNRNFITRKRITYQILFIVIFTLPPLLVDANSHNRLFFLLLYISIAFYAIKYTVSVIVFQKQYNRAKESLQNFYGDDGPINIMSWIHSTFYTIVTIGAISIFVPLTNYIVLVAYQVFLFFAYFYIYWEAVLSSVSINNPILATLDIVEDDNAIDGAQKPETIAGQNSDQRLLLLDKWIATRQYAKSGIVIDDVAAYMKTNRTTLSFYLNSELGMSFYDWISKVRIDSAKVQLINNPMLPIAEIAALVGIDDRSNFDKLFKRMMGGISPAAYRIKFAKSQIK